MTLKLAPDQEDPMAVEVPAGPVHTWMSVTQTSLRIGRSSNRVRQLRNSGVLRCQMTAIGRLVDPQSVEAYLQVRQHGGES